MEGKRAREAYRLRIGFLSEGFCQGDMQAFVTVYLAYLDPVCFDAYAYQMGPSDDLTELFATGHAAWRALGGASEDDVVAAIERDRLDLLVQLSLSDTPQLAAIRARKPARHILCDPMMPLCYLPVPGTVQTAAGTSIAPFLLTGRVRTDFLESGQVVPLDRLDFGLYTAAAPADIYRAADLSFPVAVLDEAGSPLLARAMEEAGLEGFYFRDAAAFSRHVESLMGEGALLTRLRRRLHWDFARSPVCDRMRFLAAFERRVETLAGEVLSTEMLREALGRARTAGDEADFVALAARLDVRGALPEGACLEAGRAYASLGDADRSLLWLEKAVERGEHPFLARTLVAENLIRRSHVVACRKLAEEALSSFPLEKEEPATVQTLLSYLGGAESDLGDSHAIECFRESAAYAGSEADRIALFEQYLYTTNAFEGDPAVIAREHGRYASLFTHIPRYSHERKRRHAKLRIGYLSPNFNRHVMMQFLWQLFTSYDHDAFEVYAYNVGHEDGLSRVASSMADAYRHMQGQSFAAIARQIYADEVDILVDLAGHTAGSGLPALAYRPAPVQISGLGYMTTTGLPDVDCFLTDSFVDPPEQGDGYFTEELIRLKSQFCFENRTDLPASKGSPAKERGYILFGSFNRYLKFTDAVIEDWREILARVPNSFFLVKSNSFADPEVYEVAYKRFQRAGFDMDRVLFEGSTYHYKERYLDVDILLDTCPYTGGGTTCDALFMGVPVVVRYERERHSSRFAMGILSAIGLPELASPTRKGYVETAVALASDMDFLDTLHRRLRPMMQASPLMDTEGYMKDLEHHYRIIWDRFMKG